MMHLDPDEVEVLAPNFKKRLSGVTATVFSLVPLQSRQIAIAAVGPELPPSLPQIGLGELLTMPRRGPSGARVWHARRNLEMIAGLALRGFLGKRLKLVFTSASQREHTWLTRALIARMDAVVAVSDRSAAYLKVPHTVIRHGVDADRFRPVQDRLALRRMLGLPETGLMIGCYGRVRAQKGTGDFVEAMIASLPDHPDVHAVAMGGVVGHESYARDLAARIEEAGLADRLHVLPEVPVGAMPDWYAALDLYVAPQRWEGFGLTVLEAMAAGVPVVATRVGAFEELVTEETGRLVAPSEVAALTEAVRGMLSNPDRLIDMGKAARAHVEAHHRIEHEAAALVALYRTLLGAP